MQKLRSLFMGVFAGFAALSGALSMSGTANAVEYVWYEETLKLPDTVYGTVTSGSIANGTEYERVTAGLAGIPVAVHFRWEKITEPIGDASGDAYLDEIHAKGLEAYWMYGDVEMLDNIVAQYVYEPEFWESRPDIRFDIIFDPIYFADDVPNFVGGYELDGSLYMDMEYGWFGSYLGGPYVEGNNLVWDGSAVIFTELLHSTTDPLLWNKGNGSFWGSMDFTVTAPNPSVLAPSVPEPASWAMLLIGFGLMGVGIRKNRLNRSLAIS